MTFLLSDIATLCRAMGEGLQYLPQSLDKAQFMWTVAMNESLHKHPQVVECPPRFEPAYSFGGRYCDSEQLGYCEKYGKDAACSFGPWQVMFYETHGAFKPEEFEKLEVCAQAFLIFCNRRFPRIKPTSLEECLATYNHGTYKGVLPPITQEYVRRGVEWYNKPFEENK